MKALKKKERFQISAKMKKTEKTVKLNPIHNIALQLIVRREKKRRKKNIPAEVKTQREKLQILQSRGLPEIPERRNLQDILQGKYHMSLLQGLVEAEVTRRMKNKKVMKDGGQIPSPRLHLNKSQSPVRGRVSEKFLIFFVNLLLKVLKREPLNHRLKNKNPIERKRRIEKRKEKLKIFHQRKKNPRERNPEKKKKSGKLKSLQPRKKSPRERTQREKKKSEKLTNLQPRKKNPKERTQRE